MADLYDVDFGKLTPKQREEFMKVITIISEKWECLKSEVQVWFDLIKTLVDKDIWFYDTKKRKITAYSQSFAIGFKKLVEEMEKIDE